MMELLLVRKIRKRYRRYKISMITNKLTENTEAYIAIITSNFINSEEKKKDCEKAALMNIPMYALVDEGLDMGWAKEYEWRKIYHFRNNTDIFGILIELQKDIAFYLRVKGCQQEQK
jgi:hypothetical protein